jgi:hypothetical protein
VSKFLLIFFGIIPFLKAELSLIPTARSLALAEAFVALVDDGASIYYNPGGAIRLNSRTFLFSSSLTIPFRKLHYYWGYVHPLQGGGVLSAGGISPPVSDGVETIWMLGYSHELFRNSLGLGVSGKVINREFTSPQRSELGYTFDFGLVLFPFKQFSLGVSLANLIKPSFQLKRERNLYPFEAKLGTTFRLLREKVAFIGDIRAKQSEEKRLTFSYHLGIEYQIFRPITVRLGLNSENIGMGFEFRSSGREAEVKVSYGLGRTYGLDKIQTYAHQLSVSVDFGGFRTVIKPSLRVFSPYALTENVLWIGINTRVRKAVDRWQLVIRNKMGEVIRTFAESGKPPIRLAWDGRDYVGHIVPDGLYYYEFRLIEIDDRIIQSEGILTRVKTRGPEGHIHHRETTPKNLLEKQEKEKRK